MKRAIKFLLFLLLLLALWAAHYFYLSEPVSVTYGGYEMKPPLSLALVLAAAVLLTLYIVVKLIALVLFLPRRLRRRFAAGRDARRYESLLRGLRALAVGDGAAREKYFARAAADGVSPQVAYYLAAGADGGGREGHLRRALSGGDAEIKAAARAELALAQGRADEAAALLREAGALKSPSPLLADLLRRACAGDSAGALAAVARLRELRPQDKELAAEAVRLIRTRIAAIDDPAALRDFWREHVTAADRRPVAAAYALRLDALGDAVGAAAIVAKALKKDDPGADFFAAAARLSDGKAAADALKRAEHLTVAADPGVLHAAGELAARFALWGKARQFFEMANSRAPAARTYLALAALLQKTGKSEEASEMFRRAHEIGEE